ncbi:MAG: LexA family transcriptional regulator [Clostridia bacterium]|nr:LexA family transcriptional regulator [Clostridia bacterium]
MNVGQRIKQRRKQLRLTADWLADTVGIARSTIYRYEGGQIEKIPTGLLQQFAVALDTTVGYLLGHTDSPLPTEGGMTPPTITDQVVRFGVIGEIAAGFDQYPLEDYDTDEQVEIPLSYLRGRPRSDFFVLRVTGDSMYPLYMEGDRVLIQKAPSLEHSGEIGAVIYQDYATLKKIEYVPGEDWMRLVPINPQYPPKTITGADLEQCTVLGVPKLLIRDL